jgi:hypothetical protein
MILGLESVSELRDLVKAKDVELAAIYKNFLAYEPTWRAKDLAAAKAWVTDFQALKTRYNAARAKAQETIAGTSYPDITPAQSEFNDVISALKIPALPGAPLEIPRSAVGDLYARLKNAGAPMQAYVVPQPVPGTDIDSGIYQWTGKVLEFIDPKLVGKEGVSNLEKLVIAATLVSALGTIGFALAQVNALMPRRR